MVSISAFIGACCCVIPVIYVIITKEETEEEPKSQDTVKIWPSAERKIDAIKNPPLPKRPPPTPSEALVIIQESKLEKPISPTNAESPGKYLESAWVNNSQRSTGSGSLKSVDSSSFTLYELHPGESSSSKLHDQSSIV